MCRGGRREPSFVSDADRGIFLTTLGKGASKPVGGCLLTISADWVVRKLALGHPSNVSRAMRAIPGSEEKDAVKIRRKLQACKNELHEGKD